MVVGNFFLSPTPKAMSMILSHLPTHMIPATTADFLVVQILNSSHTFADDLRHQYYTCLLGLVLAGPPVRGFLGVAGQLFTKGAAVDSQEQVRIEISLKIASENTERKFA